MEFTGQELVGYVASALVVASLAMTSVVRLRTISLFGSITFVVYGVLIESVPIVVTNASIAVINTWFLSRELGGRRDLGAVIVPADSPFLLDFLTHHASDIATFQPDYDLRHPIDFALVLTREGLPAGVVLGNRDGEQLEIDLDYVLKAYRDSRIGSWLYGRGSGVFRSAGITKVSSAAGRETHPGYLARMGFHYDPERDRFTRTV